MLPSLEGGQQSSPAAFEDCKGLIQSSSRNQEACAHRAHISTAQPDWTHQNTFWNATQCSGIPFRDSYPGRKLSIPSQQELYPHQIIIFKKSRYFFCHLVPLSETESCRGQHGENRRSLCMIPYQSKGLLNHVESYCDFSVHNWNRASVQLNWWAKHTFPKKVIPGLCQHIRFYTEERTQATTSLAN